MYGEYGRTFRSTLIMCVCKCVRGFMLHIVRNAQCRMLCLSPCMARDTAQHFMRARPRPGRTQYVNNANTPHAIQFRVGTRVYVCVCVCEPE